MDNALEIFCIQNGIPKPFELSPIRAGRNSAVFKISSNGKEWILKHYFKHEGDKRNRLDTESKFLNFLNLVGCQAVAKLIAIDDRKQLALYSFIHGTKPSIITDYHIDQATQFILLLHSFRDHPSSKTLKNAADACFDIEQHVKLVNARLEQFNRIEPDGEEFIVFFEWIKNVLHPTWLKICANVFAAHKSPLNQEVTLSPSDFGFHNTLECHGNLSFIDFEYAGWDSMAKLICDFICQPELPISSQQATQFLTKLARETNDLGLMDQVNSLLPLHRVKWCCILLNVFCDLDRQRRSHSGVNTSGILNEQFNKAKYYFETHL
ncbi:MAG: aminoglycoside phosphotransferase family protein [Polynucleobacter sp.]|nr:aminoglycoside phosphotransferase family protein [Polynucleobacter sp.]